MMSVRRRLEAVEDRLNVHDDVRVHILWSGRNEGLCRERVEEAQRRGWRLNIIRIGVLHVADTVEEAEALLAKHKASGKEIPITVYARGSEGTKTLAQWDPGLPAWLLVDTESKPQPSTASRWKSQV